MLNESAAKKIARLFLMLSSNFDGEVLAAVTAMRKHLAAERLSFHDVAAALENTNNKITAKYSEADMATIFARGVAHGRAEEARRQQMPPTFCDDDGEPRWHEMARFCQRNAARLNNWEKDFVGHMVSWTICREPSPKQSEHLLAIFTRLRGAT